MRQLPSIVLLFCFLALISSHTLADSHKSAGKQYLWQTNAYGDDVHVFSLPDFKLVKNFKVGPQPHGTAYSPKMEVMFIAIENFKGPKDELVWVNARTYEVTHRLQIGPKPNEPECTPDGKWIYVPCNDGKYWVIDGHEKKVATTIQTGGRPHNTTISSDGKTMYLSPMGKPRKVTLVDIYDNHKVIGAIPFGNSVRPPAITSDNKRFFQNIDGLIGFQVADIEKRKVIATVEHEIPEQYKGKRSRCHGLSVRPDQKEIWSCNVEHKTVHVHDITKPDYPELAALPMIGRVYWLTFSPDSRFAFVAVRSEQKVAVVDTKTRKVIRHLVAGNTPKRNHVITLPEK